MKIIYLDIFQYDIDRVDSVFYAYVNGQAFPDDKWTDLPLSVLSMWIWNIKENYLLPKSEFLLYFMDGPFYITCVKDGNLIHMKFIDNHYDEEKIVNECDMSFNELIEEILSATTNIITDIEAMKIKKVYDLKELKKSLKTLKKIQHERETFKNQDT